MQEFIAVIFSFLIISLLNKKKIPIGISICISALLMGILSGIGLSGLLEVLQNTFMNIKKLQQFIIIIEVSILGTLLRKYNILEKVIEYLTKLVPNNRVKLMFIPALVGFLSVPGGAIISAPFADKLGEESGLARTNRAIINLVFRHIAMHIMPYSTGYLLIASLAPQISIFKLIGLNSIFVALYVIAGYNLYVKQVKLEKESPSTNKMSNLVNLLKYTSPIYASILLYVFFNVPFYIGMLSNLLIVYLLNPKKTFLSDAFRAININVLYSLIGVYLIQGIIGQLNSLTELFNFIFNNPNTILLGIIGSSFFFGLTTGFQPTALGVVLPLLIALPISENRLLLYCHMTFIWGFIGYFFSPLHLCQLFTCEYMKVSLQELYREYFKFFLLLIGILISTFFVLGIWLK